MKTNRTNQISRRRFVKTGAGAIVAASTASWCRGESNGGGLYAGEGTVDVTPPIGIELAGFHRPPGKERRVEGIRQRGDVRALVLKHGKTRVAIVSLDGTGVNREMRNRLASRIEKKTGIPAANIRLCATHSHSMPTLCFYLQWGKISPEYLVEVEKCLCTAVEAAVADLAPAEIQVGQSRAKGANFNRTTKDYTTDEHFGPDSTDDKRWLDTTVQAVYFARAGKPDLLWYHFSSHPVCYTDTKAGPDWPGLVSNMCREKYKIAPSFLQGHCGDVNPGPGEPWIGKPDDSSKPVFDALVRALDSRKPIEVDTLRSQATHHPMSLDLDRFKSWMKEYEETPEKCKSGAWVDPPFAKAWYDLAKKKDPEQNTYPVPIAAIRLGELGLVFHPAELYSVYGLEIRRDSPFANTLVIGYADDSIGYAPDPNAYKAGEYAAVVVPKIMDLVPYTPTATRELAKACVGLLKSV